LVKGVRPMSRCREGFTPRRQRAMPVNPIGATLPDLGRSGAPTSRHDRLRRLRLELPVCPPFSSSSWPQFGESVVRDLWLELQRRSRMRVLAVHHAHPTGGEQSMDEECGGNDRHHIGRCRTSLLRRRSALGIIIRGCVSIEDTIDSSILGLSASEEHLLLLIILDMLSGHCSLTADRCDSLLTESLQFLRSRWIFHTSIIVARSIPTALIYLQFTCTSLLY